MLSHSTIWSFIEFVFLFWIFLWISSARFYFLRDSSEESALLYPASVGVQATWDKTSPKAKAPWGIGLLSVFFQEAPNKLTNTAFPHL